MNTICERLYEELEQMKRKYEDIDPAIKEKYRLEKSRNDQLYQDLEKWKRKFSSL